ncbi:MAG: hypothetical protein ACAI25_21375 [Planctomycetota bacterium]
MQSRTKVTGATTAIVAMLLGGGHLMFAQERGSFVREARQPRPNPFLSAPTYGVVHWDPAQTDSFPYPIPPGKYHADLKKAPGVVRGPVNTATLASTYKDGMWSCSSEGVAFLDLRAGGLEEIARAELPSAKVISKETHEKALGKPFTKMAEVRKAVNDVYGLDEKRILNNVYALVDHENVLYTNDQQGSIFAFALTDPRDPRAGIKLLRSCDSSRMLGKGEQLVGLNITYDGMLIIVGQRSLGIIDRDFTKEPHIVRFGADETISNGVSVDEDDGIYVASDKFVRKVLWTGEELSQDESRGAWSSTYSLGRTPPSVKTGGGTGSTPTLMGFGEDPDKLVVITDGSDHMNLVAFWRDKIPAGAKQQPGTSSLRMAGQIPVTCGLTSKPEFIQSEQSVAILGYGAFVVNNVREKGMKDRLVDVFAGGPVFEPGKGCERFEWDPTKHAWRSVWQRPDVVSTSMVPGVSRMSRTVVVNGYTAAAGWEMTGMDWETGGTVHRIIFGQDNLGNGAYGLIQYLPNGDLLFNGVAGPRRVHLHGGGPRE